MIPGLSRVASTIGLGVVLAALVTVTRAGPVETAIMAIMRLSDQPNYSWTTTISDDARTYDVVGKTERGGFTQARMPVVNSIRRQLGRSVTDTEIDLIFRGNVECVIETDHGWKRPNELAVLPPGSASAEADGGAQISSGAPRNGAVLPRVRPSRGSAGRDSRPRPYSNLQLGISHPHEELGIIVSSHADFNVDGDRVSGALTDLGAQLLLVRDGQENLSPVRASGTFKVWLHDGMVSKYQLKLRGTVEISLPSGARQIEVQQVSDTVLKDVGATKLIIPDEAKRKLTP